MRMDELWDYWSVKVLDEGRDPGTLTELVTYMIRHLSEELEKEGAKAAK